MAQQQHHPRLGSSPGVGRSQDLQGGTRTHSATVGAVLAGGGRKRTRATKDATSLGVLRPGASDGPIQLRPPVLLGMDEKQEATAVGLLAELIDARLAHSGLDLISAPVNGLLDPRPAADSAEPPNPAA